MSEQNEVPIQAPATSVVVEVAATPIAADRMYQLAALTAGFLLLINLL